MIDINKFLQGYIVAALWSTTDSRDEDGNGTYNLDDEFSDVSDACRAAMLSDCTNFVNANMAVLEEFKAVTNLPDDYLGHDFWLTREGHGAGFWDRGADELGEQLSKASKLYGEFPLYGDFDKGVVCSHYHG